MIPRVIPVLLLEDGGVVKTVRFEDPRYIGDPINIVRIFNDKQVDELVVLDIQASRRNRPPDVDALADMAAEAFMPIAYGGGVRDVATATTLIQAGVEKVIVNTAAVIEHDVLVGPLVHVSPAAAIGGGACILAGAVVGLGARVRDHVTVGANAFVGMGAVVVADVPAGQTVVGVPARRKERES